jgi:hypothetical protein
MSKPLQLAYDSFLRRDLPSALSQLETLFASLPLPPLEAWGVEFDTRKQRSTEQRRAQAVALFITASTMNHLNTTAAASTPSPPVDDASGGGGDVPNEAFFDSLLEKVTSLYKPAVATSPSPISSSPILPPQIINTLLSSSLSLHLPLPHTRALLESWFASLPPCLLDSLAAHQDLVDEEEKKEEWWMDEALRGYGEVFERYLVEVVLPAGKEEGKGDGRMNEAMKSLEWDGVLEQASKEVRALLLS